MTTRNFLTILFITVFFLLTGIHGIAYASGSDPEAREAIDKGTYHYGLLEDYPGALGYLKKAVELADSPQLKAVAWVKIAYVSYLMEQAGDVFGPFIQTALKLNPEMELESINYQKRFIVIFNRFKKNPTAVGSQQEKSKNTISSSEIVVDDDDVSDVTSISRGKRKKFFVKAGVYGLMHSDEQFRDIYGNMKMFPRFGTGYMIGRRLSLFLTYGFLSANATIPETDIEAKSNQSFMVIGAGYYLPLSTRVNLKADFGILIARLKEEAFDISINKTTNGFSIETGLQYSLGASYFVEAIVGYMNASQLLEDRQAKSGGLFTGLNLGLRF